MPDDYELITIDECRALLRKAFRQPVSRPTIYAHIARNNFPKNIGFGRPRLWRRADVEAWIRSVTNL